MPLTNRWRVTSGLSAVPILDPTCFDRADRRQLDHITDDLHDNDFTFLLIKDSMPLRNYLVLTHTPHLLKCLRPGTLACLVNRYYWLKKFSMHYTRRDERSVLVQKQLVAIVEAIAGHHPDFDWDIIQIIQQHLRCGDNLLEG